MRDTLTIRQLATLAAERKAPVTVQWLRRLVIKGVLKGEKIGRDYHIDREAGLAWLETWLFRQQVKGKE